MATGKGTLNQVNLIGRLGGDPELKYTQSGTVVANFSMATNRVWKDQEGNKQEETDWHRIVLWRKLAEIAGEYLKKGSQVAIIGRLQTRSWEDEKNGITRYMTEVIAEQLVMLGSKNDNQGSYHQEPADMTARSATDDGRSPVDNRQSSVDNRQSPVDNRQTEPVVNDGTPPEPQEDDLPF